MNNFEGFGLPEALIHTLTRVGYTTPTPIQIKAIPIAMEGKDILGSAQTGTGKTGAFSIPLIAKLKSDPDSMALVLTPTRELAVQVESVVKSFISKNSNLKTALLIGGEKIFKQLAALKQHPRIIIGTPGRINDHLTRRTLRLEKVSFLVLDETDRMLDMGFGVQIDKILKYVPQERQTLLFSATLPPNIVKLANKYQNSPVRIAVGSVTTPITNIKQELINTTDANKYPILLEQLHERKGSVIIFVRTKRGADRLTEKLEKDGHSADALHGDLQHKKRERVTNSFRDKKFRILVATDVAARGLDIPHIEHVINYDLPQQADDYIHRIGRTARAGAEGSALCLISPSERRLWTAIDKLINKGEHTEQQGYRGGGGNFEKRERDYSKPRGRERFGSGKRFADKPKFKKKFGNEVRAERSERPFRKEKPEFKKDFSRSDRPKRDFAERPAMEVGFKPKFDSNRKFTGKKFGAKPSFGFKKEFEGDEKPFREKNFKDKPFKRERPEEGSSEKKEDGFNPRFKTKKKFGEKKPFVFNKYRKNNKIKSV